MQMTYYIINDAPCFASSYKWFFPHEYIQTTVLFSARLLHNILRDISVPAVMEAYLETASIIY